jgi:hypothetical protein
MKEISECIGDIGRANSSIFTTLDLTSGLWQMKLDPESQPLTAFTIPNRGQFHWITSPMGLLGCPASFQRLMEQVLRGLQHILIYIDDVLIHTNTHEKHLEALEQVLMRLHQHHLKINLNKCLFGDQKVSYLGFTLTPEGIKPGEAKLKAINNAELPNDIKGIRSFMGLCNFFQHHIQDFAITAAPLFKLKARFRIPIRSTTRLRLGGVQDTPDPTVKATGTRFSHNRLGLPFDHRSLPPGSGFSRRPMRKPGTEE